MAKPKEVSREISITQTKGSFFIFRKPGLPYEKYDFAGLSEVRSLLSNEKAKILHVIRTQNPVSIYDLAKKLGRSFKSVSEDIKVLKSFGIIELKKEQSKKRSRYRPRITAGSLNIKINL